MTPVEVTENTVWELPGAGGSLQLGAQVPNRPNVRTVLRTDCAFAAVVVSANAIATSIVFFIVTSTTFFVLAPPAMASLCLEVRLANDAPVIVRLLADGCCEIGATGSDRVETLHHQLFLHLRRLQCRGKPVRELRHGVLGCLH